VLRDENLDMARRLEEAGTRVQCVVHPGASHSFLEAISTSVLAERAVDQAARWLQQTLEGHLSSPAGSCVARAIGPGGLVKGPAPTASCRAAGDVLR
jgi:hypothetical protein